MLSSNPNYPRTTVPGLDVNTLWDGLFHAATYVATVVGLFLLWSAAQRPCSPWWTKLLVGLLLIGWGTFNLGEGVVDHHLLGLHHLNETVPVEQRGIWELAFLVRGAAMLIGGWALARAGEQATVTTADAPVVPWHTPPTNGRPGVPALLVLGHLIGGGRWHVANLTPYATTGLGLLIGIALFLSGRSER